VGFEPTIPASARPQTHALDRTATGIGFNFYTVYILIMTRTVAILHPRTEPFARRDTDIVLWRATQFVRTPPRATVVYAYIEKAGGGGLNLLERRYLQTPHLFYSCLLKLPGYVLLHYVC
jgi:hypothetical protein